jgi:putative ABC transport system permease protein
VKTISLALRRLKKSKNATFFGIAGLITGLVCVMFIFFWINDEISYDHFHKNIDRIFVVHAYLEGGTKKVDFQGCPPAVAPALEAGYPEVEKTSRYFPAYFESLLSFGDRKNMVDIAYSDHALFDIFTLPFIYGNQGEPNVPGQIVLTKTTALSYFGNANPVGKIIRFNNSSDLAVTGVIEDLPANSTLQFEAVVPIENMQSFFGRENFLTTWYNNAFFTFGLLSSPAGFEKLASTITRRIQKEIPESTNYLRAYWFKNGYLYERNHIRDVRIFSLIAVLVLIASILNFINLITARSVKQAKETGLRKSIGATRWNIVRLIYSDVGILCLLAFILALAIAFIGLPLFNQVIGKQIEYSGLFSIKAIAVLTGVYLLTTLLSGSYPAFFMSSFSVTSTVNSNFQSIKGKSIFRNSLLVSIFVVSIILLASTLVISGQCLYLKKMDIGFNKDQLVYVDLKGKLKEKAKTLKEEINHIAGVSSSTVTSFLPIMVGNNNEDWEWDGKDPGFKPLVTDWNTDEDMIETLEARLIEGNYFSAGQQGVVINKAFAGAIGWDSFTGKNLRLYDQSYSIVGVIDNIQYNSLSESCRPMVIQKAESRGSRYLIIKTNTSQIDQTIKYICNTCEAIEPDFPVTYGFVSDDFAKLFESEIKLKKLVGFFSVFSIIVLCLGLLGVVMFLAEQRTKEIGVRKCLGEKEASIIVRLVKPFLLSGLVAGVIAVPATWYLMMRWLQNYTNRIELNIWTFLLAVLISMVIGVIIVSWQSWKAATRNPVEALRYE